MEGTKVIVVTCAKDEGWILERFLATCSAFADHIIISDESTGMDDSLAIYPRYPKAIVHHNPGEPAQYEQRRRFVFDEARRIPCAKRIIVAIDVDEILSANLLKSKEWQTVLDAGPGTLVHLQWVNLWKTPLRYKTDRAPLFGSYNRSIWVDDGTSSIPEAGVQGMHMVYTPEEAEHHLYLTEIVCLHYQFCNWPRMEAKHRFYRIHEKVNIRRLSDLGIWRMYGYMNSKRINSAVSPREWFDGWEKMGLEMTAASCDDVCFHDVEVLRLLHKYGPETFAYQDIWSCDWDAIIAVIKSRGKLPESFRLKKPRFSLMRRLFESYLRATIDFPFLQKVERHLLKRMSY